MLGAKPDVGVGGEVKDHVRAVHGPGQRCRIQGVASNERELALVEALSRKRSWPVEKLSARQPHDRRREVDPPMCCR